MVSVISLAVPILLSALIVFVTSSLMHMVLRYHQSDYREVPRADAVQDALRPFNIPPGDYFLPRPASPRDMKSPEFIEKMKKGPVIFMTVMQSGPPTMGQSLILWFVYCVVVGFFSAYVTGRALTPGANYSTVFRFIGTSAFMGYSLALLQFSIWYHRNWGTTIKSVFDGLVYALLTAGTFGWLWPR
ncbi:MAG: hypothetical protein HY047_12780 [Acidobacteria bacterium]|nr:hypothetical protein [Acidobacteriota bacterium]